LILEVSSPGIDRKFFNKEQYINYVGRMIKVRYRNEQMEYKSVKGFLRRVSKEAIVVEVNNEESFINFEAIEKANLEYTEEKNAK
jgi:ribosome maturation factor RimP